jgi:hypothetical protein
MLRCTIQQLQTVDLFINEGLDILHVTAQEPAFGIAVAVHILLLNSPELWDFGKVNFDLLKFFP